MAHRVTLSIPVASGDGSTTYDKNISATNPLPISGGSSSSPNISGGEFNTTAPTLTNGQTDALQLDASGNLRSRLIGASNTGADAVLNSSLSSVSLPTDPSSSSSPRPLLVSNYIFNGTTWDRMRGDTISMYSRDAPRVKTGSALTSANTTSQQVFAANPLRTRLLIQNQDAAINVFINLGAVATTGGGSLRISPGGSLDLTGTSEAVNIIAASGTPAITAWEF